MICKGRYVCEVDEYFWLSICNAVLILMDTSMFRFTMRTFLLFSFNTFALFLHFILYQLAVQPLTLYCQI